MYFLLTYDRPTAQLLTIERYADEQREQALLVRFKLERDLWGTGVEVALLSANSEDTIRKTHSRYFFGEK